MNWLEKSVNGVLRLFNLRLSRASSFDALMAQVNQLGGELDRSRRLAGRDFDHEQLLDLSQTRWRGDESDVALTWGVRMSGDAFIQVIEQHFTFENSVIVEIGPGYGRILEALLKRSAPFRRYVGLELSEARLARLREEFRDPRIEFHQADVLSRVDLDVTADLTFSSAVFEHLYPDFGRALRTIATFTRPGGFAVIDFIRDDRDPGKAAAWFADETYIRMYSMPQLEALFTRNGFSIIHSERISFGGDAANREIARTVVVAEKSQ
jgi:SAM-dependent methyltransferase